MEYVLEAELVVEGLVVSVSVDCCLLIRYFFEQEVCYAVAAELVVEGLLYSDLSR